MSVASSDKPAVNIQWRVNIALGLCCISFFVIVLRLWYLQILRGEYFREQSENNRLSTVYVPAPRGIIYDRSGKPLVANRPAFDIELVEEDSPKPKETIRRLAEILGLPPENLTARPQQNKRRRFEPRLLLHDVDRDTLAKVAAHRYELPGVVINVDPARQYLFGGFAAHVLGYIREITKSQLESSQYSGYRSGDLVGQFGVESRWEKYLQGKRGVQLVIVNASGTRIGESSFEPEESGHDVTLTIEYATQKAAEDALAGKRGSIVAMDPRTGEVLALASSPGFDPNVFTGELTGEEWKELNSGKEKRLNNRAMQGTYPPGSIFKTFMAVAGLTEGVVTKNERIFCPGYLHFGNRNYGCHKKSGHGSVDLKEALVQSCDVYFYTVGQRLGVDRIHEYATKFGFGMPTKLELAEEAKGLIPSTEWKRRAFKNPGDQKWYPGETLSVAIGQGAVTVTPLQATRALAALVNGGRLLRPYLVKAVGSKDGSFHDDTFGPQEEGKVDLDPEVLATVKAGLVGVVNDPRGTAHRAQLDKSANVVVAGKTGTAQVVSLNMGSGAEHHNDHAWFSAYAPADNPTIVVTALVENGGHGGVAAAPLVRQVMEAHFGVGQAVKDQGKEEASEPAD
ncbi:MAG: penicillin-binding protein 2 [Deltaproteobacteria bacterium]|nr:penicillin-binding protein 2 [Deltaproteobacteria bacterium]